MLTVIIIMTAGIFTGYVLRNRLWIHKPVSLVISLAIYLLLFLLGINVGSNSTIMTNLEIIGVEALFLTIGAVTGSVVLSYFTYKLFFRENEK